MEAKAEMIEPLVVKFADLLHLSSDDPSRVSSCPHDLERLDSISTSVMQALGPSGPGLLAVSGVRRASRLRRTLLPLARKLALLGNKDRVRVLKDHGLGSDVSLKNLDRTVSSFAMQLKYTEGLKPESFLGNQEEEEEENHNREETSYIPDSEFKHLGDIFKELGLCMMELGLSIARVCDKAIGESNLEETIVDSLTAKGRLIHYHSTLDNINLKGISKRHSGVKGSNDTSSSLWQQWHYDYGIFTVLTTPLFMSSIQKEGSSCVSSIEECSSPDGHTYLQLFDTTRDKILFVKSQPECFIVQVGESATVLSRGRLRSSLHSVKRPLGFENLSRETFVLFLQPAWDKALRYSENLRDAETENSRDPYRLMEEISMKIPPLSSRLRDGMTFAEFSRETTKQYFGVSGTQHTR